MRADPKRWATRSVSTVALVGLGLVLASCGDDDAVPSTLPPLTTVPPSTTIAVTTTTGPAQYYEVQPGDSLSAIAQRFDVRIEDLIALNGITNPDQIQAGQKLQIPPPTVLITGNDGTTTSSDQVP